MIKLGVRTILTEDNKKDIKRLYVEEKLFMTEVARKLNLSPNIVKKELINQGIEIDHRGKRKNNYIIDEENNIAKIELKRRKGKESLWTIIDLDDLEKVLNFPYGWHPSYNKTNGKYYAHATIHIGKINGKEKNCKKALQCIILEGDVSNDEYVDHISHDTLDNRKENLRLIKNSENLKNRKGKNSNNVSGYRNVMYLPYRKKTPYHVQLTIDGKNKCFGKFATAEEAGKCAEEMRQKYYGEFAGAS
jgi:transposase-like protein